MNRLFFLVTLCLASLQLSAQAQQVIQISGNQVVIKSKGQVYTFKGEFSVSYSAKDPEMALRPAGIKGVSYNVMTWITDGKGDLKQAKVNKSVAGDGFDDKVLAGDRDLRTANFMNVGSKSILKPIRATRNKNTLNFTYPDQELFKFSA